MKMPSSGSIALPIDYLRRTFTRHSSLVITSTLSSNFTQSGFEDIVRAAKEHIAAGDIFQVVLSQRLSRHTSALPFDIYRALRRLNPSPYMFFSTSARLR